MKQEEVQAIIDTCADEASNVFNHLEGLKHEACVVVISYVHNKGTCEVTGGWSLRTNKDYHPEVLEAMGIKLTQLGGEILKYANSKRSEGA